MEIYKSLFLKERQTDYMSILLEKTFDLDKDVDYIYKKVFKEFVENFIQKKITFHKVKNNEIIIKSNELKNEDSIKANNINPVDIHCKIFDESGSFYQPLKSKINIALGFYALQVYIDLNFNIEVLEKQFGKNTLKQLENEITEHKVKSTIYHELSHWVSDSLHNRHAKNLIDLVKKYNNPELKLLGQKDVDLTYFEIDAQIHAIKNLKNNKKKEWDKLIFDDIFFLYPSLRTSAQEVHEKFGKEVLEIWEKNLLKRMNHEGLLGKNMKGFIDLNILKENIGRI